MKRERRRHRVYNAPKNTPSHDFVFYCQARVRVTEEFQQMKNTLSPTKKKKLEKYINTPKGRISFHREIKARTHFYIQQLRDRRK